jgi:hypothetical protein
MMLSEEVARCWVVEHDPSDEEAREASFARIRDTLLAFTARGRFAQVMQQEHHHTCYRRWQETFQIDQLYREVSDEVREMWQYVLTRRTERLAAAEQAVQERVRRLEQRLSQFATLLGVPGLALAFLSIVEQVEWWVAALVVVGSLVAGALLLWATQAGAGRD